MQRVSIIMHHVLNTIIKINRTSISNAIISPDPGFSHQPNIIVQRSLLTVLLRTFGNPSKSLTSPVQPIPGIVQIMIQLFQQPSVYVELVVDLHRKVALAGN
jgi:hypothetical protein